jgi:hypothetical protein
MPPLRTRTRKSRPAIAMDSPTARMIQKIPPTSLMEPMESMLDTITVAAITAPVPAPPSLLIHPVNVIETSDAIATDVRNQAAIAGALTRANHMLQSNRAENTKKAYASKKNLWSAWCQARKFKDGETVTEGKLCLWLHEEVFVNGSQAQGDLKGSMLSPQGVEGYIKPIIALYEVPIYAPAESDSANPWNFRLKGPWGSIRMIFLVRLI